MNIPGDLLYVDTHEWIRVQGDVAVIGITDYAQSQLGDVTFVELPAVGAEFKQGQEMGSVESVKAVSDLFCPVSGKITEVNDALDGAPELVNKAPYGDGWMIKVKLSAKPAGTLSAAEYGKLVSA